MKTRRRPPFFAACLFLCCKRQLRLPAFWGCALAFLSLIGGFLLLCPEPRGISCEIGLLFDAGDPALLAACGPLAGEAGLPFRFYRPGEEEEMRRAVLTGALHCGYLLEPAADPPVTVYETAGSFLRPVADELVFGALFELEAPSLASALLAEAGGDPAAFAPGEAAPMSLVLEPAGAKEIPASVFDLRPLLFAVLSSLFVFLSFSGGLFTPGETPVFAALETVRPGAKRLLFFADALACALLQGLLLSIPLLAAPALRGAASGAALPLLILSAALLRQGASRLAGRFPRAVSAALFLSLCWALLAVCFSGALLDPTMLGPVGVLRFLSPAWILSQLAV